MHIKQKRLQLSFNIQTGVDTATKLICRSKRITKSHRPLKYHKSWTKYSKSIIPQINKNKGRYNNKTIKNLTYLYEKVLNTSLGKILFKRYFYLIFKLIKVISSNCSCFPIKSSISFNRGIIGSSSLLNLLKNSKSLSSP